jgi:hypothetical protein
VITDSDGRGQILINGAPLAGTAVLKSAGVWTLGDYQILRDGTGVRVYKTQIQDGIQIVDTVNDNHPSQSLLACA